MIPLLPLVWLAGCAEDPVVCKPGWTAQADGTCLAPSEDTGEAAPAPTPEVRHDPLPLPAPALLRRVSLDLRGTLPTQEELDAVEAAPGALDDYIDEFLDDPRLEDRLAVLLGEHWHTLVDDVTLQFGEAGFDATEEFAYERSVGEEPLRLMAHVATQDLPWTQIVTADYTLANDVLAEIWPLDHPGDGSGWQVARYTDGRPSAGVLATNGLWWRYGTNESNANRGRAAAISRLLLCEDYLSRPITFARNQGALDEDATADALLTDPACTNCHATLEPLAATLFGFWWFEEHHLGEISIYHASREPLGGTILGVDPAWYGVPIGGLADLGEMIAADPRFSRCTAEAMAGLLWQRPVENADFAQISALEAELLDSDWRMKALLKAILQTPAYRAGSWPEGADELYAEQTRRMLSPDQLASVHADLTGFSWTWQGFDQMANDSDGYRVLAGGIDGVHVTTRQREPGLTWALVVRRLAEASADHVVQADLGEGATPRLLDQVGVADRPGDTAFDTQLAALGWRLYGERLDDTERGHLGDLWSTVDAADGPQAAWAAVLTAMLRDPAFVSY